MIVALLFNCEIARVFYARKHVFFAFSFAGDYCFLRKTKYFQNKTMKSKDILVFLAKKD